MTDQTTTIEVDQFVAARLFLAHSAFDLDDKRMNDAFTRMGPGWRDVVLPRLAQAATALPA